MRRIPYHRGSSRPKLGALVDDAALDLAAVAADLARERGTVRHGRGGFPRTMLSQGFTILPGDVIATGTPEGAGAALGKFLNVGDRIEAEVERIGALANRVGAPKP